VIDLVGRGKIVKLVHHRQHHIPLGGASKALLAQLFEEELLARHR
jgi:hypothetical protein